MAAEAVADLHRDLVRKYRTHGPRLKELWRRMTPDQRTKAMKAGAADGVVLRHSLDPSMGNVCKLMPEWNLRDITVAGSDILLHMLEFRATKTLQEQYISGFDGRPGDYEHIVEMMRTRNLQLIETFPDCFTIFTEGQDYGSSFKIVKDKSEILRGLKAAIDSRLCIPQSVGELVLTRQSYLLQFMNIMIEDILDVGSTTRSQKKELPKKSSEAATSALAQLSLKVSASKLDLAGLLDMALDQKASFDDNLALLCTEPHVLSHALNIWFFSRPELLADEMGRQLPAHTDKYISGTFLDIIHNAVKGAAVWNYMCRLLELLKDLTGKSQRAIILQEIANVCHLEYSRVQAMLRRQVSIGTGLQCFKRVSNAYDNGNARIALKGKPEALAGQRSELQYLLHLCQAEVTASKAVEWLTKLDEFYSKHPGKRDHMHEKESDALGDLAVIVASIQSLSPAISMPAFNRKKGQQFVTGVADLEAELNNVKPELDLGDFAVPIDNLLEPGMAEAALKAFDKFIVEKTGTKMGMLYLDLIDDCIMKLREQLVAQDKREAERKAGGAADSEYIPFPSEPPKATEVRVQERRQKEKTRPAHTSVYQISASSDLEATAAAQAPPPPSKPFKVKATTAEVFSTLFGKSEYRGSIAWAQFEAALADLGFSVLPKFGSVFTFFPPESMAIQKPLTLHRPHQSRIEGFKLLVFARRLNRTYGWGEETFQVA